MCDTDAVVGYSYVIIGYCDFSRYIEIISSSSVHTLLIYKKNCSVIQKIIAKKQIEKNPNQPTSQSNRKLNKQKIF
eukprot:UN02318